MQSTDMRIRAAAALIGLMSIAALAGHLLGGHAVARALAAPAPSLETVNVSVPAGQPQGTHLVWLPVNGRWRAVPP